ncbi:MAG: hypothetical protein CMH48_07775 [Muricauda sp.]|nr:hypothetical protein [Allomuricauda sp.]MBC30731.1 hypothetical protein [Allomuricauda sp.]|tara:strand:+ start:49 stop:492 length:444 start_codon:yes stop_codon:yes gene_type:complete
MKPFLFLFVGIVLTACSDSVSDQPFDVNGFPQQWELTGMSGSISGFILEGDDLPWKETIVLNIDETFIKIREIDVMQSVGTGSFLIEESEGETYLVLDYSQETDLIESCTREKIIEKLFMPSPNSLTGGSAPCDGPGLFYSRVDLNR